MPHKRNPRAAEFTEAVARLGRQRASGLAEIVGQEHDRCGGTYICEWMLLPEAFLLSAGALKWSSDLIDRLEIHPEVMRANIDRTNGMAMSERYTLYLAAHMSKFDARRLMDAAVAKAFADGTPLPDILCAMPEVTAVLSPEDIKSFADPDQYVGASGKIVDRVLAHSKPDVKP